MARIKRDTVNLDALLKREDLTTKKPGTRGSSGINVTELAHGKHIYGLLRKPNFQRETDDWSLDNVVSLIKSFRDGHLIPAVILWPAEGYLFVIDGAHRLSAFIAWVNDDYGDRHISQNFFGTDIPKRQLVIAKECRERVAEAGCTYSDLQKLTLVQNRSAEQLSWSTNIAAAIETQWVNGGAEMAATSFLAINQRAIGIEPTERYMIENLGSPNVVAARALVRSARGHAFWGDFATQYASSIEVKARLIYNAIFEPEDAEPHTNTDLQPAGRAYTANGLRLALDLVNIVNDVKGTKAPEKDETGESTARFIEKTYGVVKYVAGDSPASLNLHPAVYFWGSTGNHRPSIFLAMVSLVQEMVSNDELIKFTMHRAKLEEFLIGDAAKEVLGKHGGWKKSVAPVKKMLRAAIEGFADGKTEAQILEDIKAHSRVDIDTEFVMRSGTTWRETKASMRHRASLASAQRCPICKARLVMAHMSDDHKIRQIERGSSDVQNGQLTHQFCNHGFKEHFAQKGLPSPEIALPV